MGLLYDDTDWYLSTSHEDGSSIWLFSGAEGTLYFANDKTHQQLSVDYSYNSVGLSKGAGFNVEASTDDDPSGSGAVQVSGGGRFGVSVFPCMGFAVMLGASAGVFVPSFVLRSGISGMSLQFGLGLLAKAKVNIWGTFNTALPTVGPSLGLFSFKAAKMEALK